MGSHTTRAHGSAPRHITSNSNPQALNPGVGVLGFGCRTLNAKPEEFAWRDRLCVAFDAACGFWDGFHDLRFGFRVGVQGLGLGLGLSLGLRVGGFRVWRGLGYPKPGFGVSAGLKYTAQTLNVRTLNLEL